MAEIQDTLDIIITDDHGVAPKDGKAEPQKKAAPAAKEQQHPAVDDLRGQLASLKAENAKTAREKEEAERRVREHAESISKIRGELGETKVAATLNAIATSRAALDLAQRQMKEALEAGEFDKFAQINTKMVEAAADLKHFERMKSELEAAAKAKPAEEPITKEVRADQSAPADPAEDYISRFSPRSQRWLREHKEFATDRRKNAAMLAAHHDAVAQDFVEESDAYFDFIERKLGLKKSAAEAEADVSDDDDYEPSASAAPVTRTPTSQSDRRQTVVKLTREERDMAEALGMTVEAYARSKVEVEKAKRA